MHRDADVDDSESIHRSEKTIFSMLIDNISLWSAHYRDQCTPYIRHIVAAERRRAATKISHDH